jgi:hypothetical protein
MPEAVKREALWPEPAAEEAEVEEAVHTRD